MNRHIIQNSLKLQVSLLRQQQICRVLHRPVLMGLLANVQILQGAQYLVGAQLFAPIPSSAALLGQGSKDGLEAFEQILLVKVEVLQS
jgi:hypothetical protein